MIGDGREILLFYDNWLPDGSLYDILGNQVKAWGEELKVSSWWSAASGWNIPTSFKRRFPKLSEIIAQVQAVVSVDKSIMETQFKW